MRFALAMLTGALVLILAIAPRVRAQGHMHSMQRHGTKAAATAADTSAGTGAVYYTCPMDPEVVSKTPGKCPKCGMKLVRKSGTARAAAGTADSTAVAPGHKHETGPDTGGQKKHESMSDASTSAGCSSSSCCDTPDED